LKNSKKAIKIRFIANEEQYYFHITFAFPKVNYRLLLSVEKIISKLSYSMQNRTIKKGYNKQKIAKSKAWIHGTK